VVETAPRTKRRTLRVVIAHGPEANTRELRQIVHGAGLECGADDCVAFDDLSLRLARGNADLLVLRMGDDVAAAMRAVADAQDLTAAPIIAVGPLDNASAVESVRRAGIEEYLDVEDLRGALDTTMEKMSATGAMKRSRGSVYSVYSATAGSGCTTVAANLAGAYLAANSEEVAVVEMSRGAGDLSLLLDVTPKYTLDAICQRWDRLDATSLRHGMALHNGLHVLPAGTSPDTDGGISTDAVRRIGVLARTVYQQTVLALDSVLGDEEIEAMKLSDAVLLVVRADVPAVRRARAALDAAVESGVPRERFRLIINRYGQGGSLKTKQVETSLGLKTFEVIPDDPTKVNKAANRGLLLAELARHSSISRRFSALAAALEGRKKRDA